MRMTKTIYIDNLDEQSRLEAVIDSHLNLRMTLTTPIWIRLPRVSKRQEETIRESYRLYHINRFGRWWRFRAAVSYAAVAA